MSASPNAVMDQVQGAAQKQLAAGPVGADPADILKQKQAALDPMQAQYGAAQKDLAATPQPGPANLPQAPNKPLVDPGEYSKFSAFLVAMSAIAGAKSGNWMGASASLNGALKGYIEGNQQKGDADWKKYQADYDKAVAQHKEQEEDYAQTINSKKLSINQMFQEMQMKAAKYGDDYTLALSQRKSFDELAKNVFGMAQKREALDTKKQQIDAQVEKSKVSTGTGNVGDVDTNARAIAEYREPQPTLSSRNPLGYKLMARVMELNPDYDANQYKNRGKIETAFGAGKQGDTVRSLNVAVQHLNLLEGLGKELDNSDSRSVNNFYNSIGKQFGKTNVTNFETAKTIVGDEVVKAVVGGGAGSLADREDLQAKFDASSTPEQLVGVIATAKGLMAGQLKGLRTQYEGSGRKDFETKLDPETRQALEDKPGATAHPPEIQSLLDKYK